jgi:hypothetical protein
LAYRLAPRLRDAADTVQSRGFSTATSR